MSDDVVDDQVSEFQTKTRIFAIMGLGTFALVVLVVVVAAIWFFSYSCASQAKVTWRTTSILIFGIVAAILITAPRKAKYETNEYEDEHYDYSIIPRIAVSLVTILFGLLSTCMLCATMAEKKTLSTVEHEYSELWQEE
ncbi:hypothetical protein B484DRAFT_414754 [Ochromonadaceae sp. CCMP2298]|nr:hypothetical protein B484DRAFT_414754 [Ochromonadaceae sp. CCMP2298]|mmetsp:Transcript_15770/g.34885  ORF Transcript_15770/g.34885 Transcript_15770/m.34885 type:complete len:139 (+) Transcript_15770:142-558(+)|eukprot:CAMPEP_0173178640 /NCGR_PEP_ID=MMETSP1141-20130122/5650_1 /TAXON_ID=483371 /ORGANISM="non described non described, Strain CCMP2298" /LENGTH=138 /DNA_ID=CAMNT_0014101157 /DNA_START=44 /DNA_END=460 /DNA_ORIENTATION=+